MFFRKLVEIMTMIFSELQKTKFFSFFLMNKHDLSRKIKTSMKNQENGLKNSQKILALVSEIRRIHG